MHENQRIQFVDSDDEIAMHVSDVQHQEIAQPLPPATPFHLLHTINTDYNSQDQCYVLQLAYNSHSSLVAAALSNKQTKLYSLGESNLHYAGDLIGHTSSITDIQTSIPDEPHLIFTCSADKTIQGWDLRTRHSIESYTVPNYEVSCCSSNGTLIAAGARDKAFFWDRRLRKPIIAFGDTHATNITQVKFHPEHRSAFISGSEDGLIAVFDTSQGVNEDEGFRAALNIDTSVARIGFYKDRLWCCSGTETLHLWEWSAACDDETSGGNGAFGDAYNAREQCTMSTTCRNNNADTLNAVHMESSSSITSPSTGNTNATTINNSDYLIQCEYDEACDALALAAGTSDGDAALFKVIEPERHTIGNSLKITGPGAVFQGGHIDVVRSMALAGGVWLTGGEDARICVWSATQNAATDRDADDDGSGGKPTSRQYGHHMRRASPY